MAPASPLHRRGPRPVIALLATLAAACGGGSATQAGGTAGASPADPAGPTACTAPPVHLRFAWPEQVTARVRGLDVTESQNLDGSSPMRGESPSELTMEARTVGQERHVRFVVAGATRTRSQGLAPDVDGLRPTWVLAADGSVVRVEGVPEMKARIRELVAAGELEPEVLEVVAPNLTPQAQLGTARAHWTWITHAWNGRELRCGEPVRERMQLPALGLGAASGLEADVTMVYQDALDCPTGPPARCVLLQSTTEVDSAALTASIQRHLGTRAGRLLAARVVRTVRLLTEPDTLLPHAVAFEEEQRLHWDVDGDRYSRVVRDIQAYEMTYDAPGATAATRIFYDRDGGGYAVLGPDGQPVELPQTETCRAFARCCQAAAHAAPTVSLTCGVSTASMATSGADDCDEGLATVRALLGRTGQEVPECAPP